MTFRWNAYVRLRSHDGSHLRIVYLGCVTDTHALRAWTRVERRWREKDILLWVDRCDPYRKHDQTWHRDSQTTEMIMVSSKRSGRAGDVLETMEAWEQMRNASELLAPAHA